MIRYIIKRLLQLIPILIGITFLSFAMMRLAGGDAVTYMYDNAGASVSQEVIDQTKKEYGLDQPFLVQYAKWFAGMVTGDMGTSYVSKRDVYDTFAEKLPATILLTVSSVILTMLIAIPLGIISAVKHNKWGDYLIRFLSFIGNSMPNFFAALVLMYFFSIKLGWLPVITTDNVVLSLVLPTLTLTIIDGIQVYAAGESNNSGGTEQGLCDRSACKRSARQRDHLAKCHEIFDAYDHYSACSVDWKSARRHDDR